MVPPFFSGYMSSVLNDRLSLLGLVTLCYCGDSRRTAHSQFSARCRLCHKRR